jgi:hypothetical protein
MNFGEAASVVPTFALEAPMTHNLNYREQPVQKAGQKAGAVLPPSPNTNQVPSDGADRVAEGETLSKKTSTAALASFRRGPLLLQRRAPRHRADGSPERSAGFYASALDHYKSNPNPQEKTMNATTQRKNAILLLIIGSLLFAFAASAADLRISQIQPKEHRVVLNFPLDHAQAEDLQRWVNAGHDPWCRDPQLVAASALTRVSSQFSEYEPASLQLETSEKTKAVYSFHSLDGQTTYRITLRRYRFLLPTAGSLQRIIWIPETAEIISHDTRD